MQGCCPVGALYDCWDPSLQPSWDSVMGTGLDAETDSKFIFFRPKIGDRFCNMGNIRAMTVLVGSIERALAKSKRHSIMDWRERPSTLSF